jgi:plasmid stabilization system protein ParE
MSYIVKWTENAGRGLERAYLFLAEKSEEAAIAAIKAIREKASLLERSPSAGRPADDLDPEHRELIVPFGASGYVLIYEVHEDHVLILAVKHQKEAGY